MSPPGARPSSRSRGSQETTETGRGSHASPVYERIWQVVKRIPRGRVATYGQIAALAGIPRQPRMVGYALHRLPPGVRAPWHRVINARGEISFRPGGLGEEGYQKALLEAEGIRFEKGRVDLARYGWRPRI